MTVKNPNRPIPRTIGLLFGGLWGLLGVLALPVAWRLACALTVGFVSIFLVIRLWHTSRSLDPASSMFRRWPYLLAVTLEIMAIYTVSAALPRYGLQAYFIEVLGVIVGLHFIGLWWATGLTRFLWIAAGLCGVSAIAMALPRAWEDLLLRDAVTGVGNALVLWIGASRSPKLKVAPGTS
jgi:hypothetical protein